MATCVLLSNMVYAQQLNLFEETETSISSGNEPSRRESRRDSDGNLITGPEFTLVGTSRVGAKFLAVVKDSLGEIISVSMNKDATAPITGHPGFELASIGSGEVTIRYPDGVDCQNFQNQAVFCEGANIARLGLANLEPLVVSNEVRSNQNLGDGQNEVDSANGEITTNPFEALLQRAANSDGPNDSSGFEPVRIDPSDVPPGMRVVSTPFGDRLVEEE